MAAATLEPKAPPKPPRLVRRNVYLRDEKGGTFRIIFGSCYEPGPKGCQCNECLTPIHGSNPPKMLDHLYEAYDPRRHGPRDGYVNDIIVSERDLQARMVNKFERLDDSDKIAYGAPAERPLDTLNFQQLLTVAEEQGVDVRGESRKDKVLDMIRKAIAAK